MPVLVRQLAGEPYNQNLGRRKQNRSLDTSSRIVLEVHPQLTASKLLSVSRLDATNYQE